MYDCFTGMIIFVVANLKHSCKSYDFTTSPPLTWWILLACDSDLLWTFHLTFCRFSDPFSDRWAWRQELFTESRWIPVFALGMCPILEQQQALNTPLIESYSTVMILSFRTNRSRQTVQTQNRAVWSGSTLFAIPSASFRSTSASFGSITEW